MSELMKDCQFMAKIACVRPVSACRPAHAGDCQDRIVGYSLSDPFCCRQEQYFIIGRRRSILCVVIRTGFRPEGVLCHQSSFSDASHPGDQKDPGSMTQAVPDRFQLLFSSCEGLNGKGGCRHLTAFHKPTFFLSLFNARSRQVTGKIIMVTCRSIGILLTQSVHCQFIRQLQLIDRIRFSLVSGIRAFRFSHPFLL